MKNIIKRVSAFAMAFALIGTGTTVTKSLSPKSDTTITASAAGYSTSYTYRTSATDLRIRQGAGTQYPQANVNGSLAHIRSNTNFKISKVSGSWGYSSALPTSTGKTVSGWVSLSYCNYFTITLPGKKRTVKVNSSLNVRSGPSTSYSVVGSKYNNDVVYVYATCGSFAAINVAGTQWVSKDYLK